MQKMNMLGEMVVDIPCCSPTSFSSLDIIVSRSNTSSLLGLEVLYTLFLLTNILLAIMTTTL
jgi:hypothetical protein